VVGETAYIQTGGFWHFSNLTLPPNPYNTTWQRNNTHGSWATVNINDTLIRETRLTTGHNQTDYQLYEYYNVSTLNTFNISWTGYGDNNTNVSNYNVSIYIWKSSTDSWELLNSTESKTYKSLTYNFGSSMNSYKDGNNSYYILVGANHSDYAPSWISQSVSAGIVYGSATDEDGTNLIEYNFTELQNGNSYSGWSTATSWNSGAGTPPAGSGCGDYVYWYYTAQARENGVYLSTIQVSEHGAAGTNCPVSCPFVYIENQTTGIYTYTNDFYGASTGVRAMPIKDRMNITYDIDFTDTKLIPENGKYSIHIRESLAEADFFDLSRLYIIDVPKGYTPFSTYHDYQQGAGYHMVNGVRFNYTKESSIDTVKKPWVPISVIDKYGNDTTYKFSKVDDIAGHETLNRMNYYTMDFGKINHPEYAKMIIYGWSKASQKPNDSETGLSPKYLLGNIEVINQSGQWQKVGEIGKMAGDLRPSLYNISNIWLTDDHRIRLWGAYTPTTISMYDMIVIDDSAPVDIELSVVNVSKATLFHSGKDNVSYVTENHSVIATGEFIPDNPITYFYGNFTRYGDVTPLLQKLDDMYVIIRSGDEMDLEFPELAPKQGKDRKIFMDAFSWYYGRGSVAGDKNDNITQLPFIKMTKYPYNILEQNYPWDEEHIEYNKTYNTRECQDRINFTCKDSALNETYDFAWQNVTQPEIISTMKLCPNCESYTPPHKPKNDKIEIGNLIVNDDMPRSLNTNFLSVIFSLEEEEILTYMPPAPTNIQGVTGNFYVNTSWQPGIGNLTNSFNVSINGTWYNGTTTYHLNLTKLPHGWANVTVQAFNSSGTGLVNTTAITNNTQIPNNAPTQSEIGAKSATENSFLNFSVVSTDLDGDALTYDTNATKGTINSTGFYSWNITLSESGTYYFEYNTTDNFSAVSNEETVTITINNIDFIPPVPVINSTITGNFYINTTWNAGAVNITDGYNSTNGTIWINNTATYRNTTLSSHGWQNVTVYSWNSSYGNISLTALTNNTQIPNNIPVLSSIGAKSGNEGYWLNFSVVGTDADGDSMTCASNQTVGALSGCSFNWSINYTSAGTYNWIFYYNDSYEGSDSEVVTFTIAETNLVPFTPRNLTWTNGTTWVNHTWETGEDTHNIVANNTIRYSSDSESSNVDYFDPIPWSKVREFTLSNTYNGSIRTSFQLSCQDYELGDPCTSSGFIVYGRIYKDDVALGTSRSTQTTYPSYDTYTEDFNINWSSGSKIQLWIATNSGMAEVFHKNYRLSFNFTGGDYNITDSFNISHNGTWYNGTTNQYFNATVGKRGWSNISVYAYNSTSLSLNLTPVSNNIRARIGEKIYSIII